MSIPFLRKLQALEYPDIASISSCTSSSAFSSFSSPSFRTLVAWLELTKIRFWPVEQREPLKQLTHPQWNEVCCRYLSELDCPRVYASNDEMSVEQVNRIVDWLLNQAIGAEFADHAGEYNSLSKMWFISHHTPNQTTSASSTDPSSSSSSSSSSMPVSLSSASISTAEFEDEIANLAKLFQIPLDSKQKASMIRVIRKRIEESNLLAMTDAAEKSLNSKTSSISSSSSADSHQKGKGKQSTAAAGASSTTSVSTRPTRSIHAKEIDGLPTTREGVFSALDELERGFPSTNHQLMDRTAQVFRLLFLHDLRSTQSMANELMMLAQEYTSDPKTDAKLGKVGI